MDQQNQGEQFVDVTHTGSDQLKQETALDAFLAKRSIAASGARWGNVFFGIQVLAVFIVSCMATLQVNLKYALLAGLQYWVMSHLIGKSFFLGLSGFSTAGMPRSQVRGPEGIRVESDHVKGAKAKVVGTFVLLFTAAMLALLIFIFWVRFFRLFLRRLRLDFVGLLCLLLHPHSQASSVPQVC